MSNAHSESTSPDVLSDAADEQDLILFGYPQRLRRSMSTFTSFCLAFSMVAITGIRT